MPNHVTNKLTFIGEQEEIKKLTDAIRSEESKETLIAIDFEKIIPMPKELRAEVHSGIDSAVKWALKMIQMNVEDMKSEKEITAITKQLESISAYRQKSPLEFSDEDWCLFIQCLNNVRKYGHMYWYSWSIENWGTKWNAYEQSEEENLICFDTAWSTPFPVIKRLSELFPKVQITLEYADENIGYNVGNHTFRKGELITSFAPEGGSYEARKSAFEIKQVDPVDHGCDPISLEYIKEEGIEE